MDYLFMSIIVFSKSCNRSKKAYFGLVVTLLFSINYSAYTQILRDTSRIQRAKECIGDIYNSHFNEAEEICNQFGADFPDSPVPPLIRGMIIYWKNFPLLPSSPERDSYESELKLSISISEKNSPQPGDEAEYLLADLCARGLLLVFYSDNDLSSEVIPMAAGTYHFLRESFRFTSVYPDFCFFTGLYNYYREKYPMIHPVYKAFALLFPAGDVNKGLAELQKAASEGTVLDAEAGFMLSWIYAGYEYDYEKSLKYSRLLYEKYPGNSSYLANYIKFLLLVKQYDEAEKLIFSAGSKINNTFFRAQITVFNGILKEKKYRDISAALECYREGLNYLVPFGDFGNEYSAYACYGLSRVYAADKTGDLKRRFRKEANRLAEFRHMNFER
jgi:hypothetical protein